MATKIEILFGQIALAQGYCTEEQLEQLLQAQRKKKARKPLGLLMMDQGLIQENDLKKILEIQRKNIEIKIADRKLDNLLRKAILHTGWISVEQLNVFRRANQEKMKHGEFLSLEQYLLVHQLLTQEQLRDIYHFMGNQQLYCPKCSLTFFEINFQVKKLYRCPKCHFKAIGEQFISASTVPTGFSNQIIPLDSRKLQTLSAQEAMQRLLEGQTLENVYVENLDLSGHHFRYPLQIHHCILNDFIAVGAIFDKSVSFKSTSFQGRVFLGSLYDEKTNLLQEGCIFREEVTFHSAIFDGEWAIFSEAYFAKDLSLDAVTFACSTYLEDVFVGGSLYLNESTFGAEFFLNDSKIKGTFALAEASFAGPVNYSNCEFFGECHFEQVYFGDYSYFEKTKFKSDAYFPEANFANDVSFQNAKFKGVAYFNESFFTKNVVFSGTRFHSIASFQRTTFKGKVDFGNALFYGERLYSPEIIAETPGEESLGED